MKKQMWAASGFLMGLTALSLSLGDVPKLGQVTDDTAIYQNLSEIRAQKQRDLNFDGDIDRLSAMEARYAERLPELSRLEGPGKRIAAQPYRYRAKKPQPVRAKAEAKAARR
jgi:hypothetical protein